MFEFDSSNNQITVEKSTKNQNSIKNKRKRRKNTRSRKSIRCCVLEYTEDNKVVIAATSNKENTRNYFDSKIFLSKYLHLYNC